MITPTQIGNDCILYEGRAEEVLPLIQAESVDLTVTSPPYDDLRTYNGNSEFDFEKIAQELFRITKRGGVVVWVVGDATIDGSESGTSFRQALGFMESGFKLHDTMIYRKLNGGMNGSNKCYLQAFEYMFILAKGTPKTIRFIRDRKNVVAARVRREAMGRRFKNGERKGQREITRTEFGIRTNVWEYFVGNNEVPEHPAVFPTELAVDHIESWSNKDETVLDCFAGSGTTGKAAKLRGRKSILIEVDSSSISLIKKRLANTQPLFDQSVPAKISTNCT